MSDEKKDGGPAFPMPGNEHQTADYGMTLRDYFAGQVMVGLVESFQGYGNREAHAKDAAETAYILADAMLAERAKR